MTALSDHQLYEAGMSTDQIAGFRAMVANPKTPTRHAIGLAPDHFRGKRLDEFERGAFVGHTWLTLRQAAASARRRIRAEEIAQTGACTPLSCMTPEKEAIDHLQQAVRVMLGKNRYTG